MGVNGKGVVTGQSLTIELFWLKAGVVGGILMKCHSSFFMNNLGQEVQQYFLWK